MNNRFDLVKHELVSPHSVNPKVCNEYNFSVYVLKDKVTGVLYLYNEFMNRSGLTVLVDADGKPLTSL